MRSAIVCKTGNSRGLEEEEEEEEEEAEQEALCITIVYNVNTHSLLLQRNLRITASPHG